MKDTILIANPKRRGLKLGAIWLCILAVIFGVAFGSVTASVLPYGRESVSPVDGVVTKVEKQDAAYILTVDGKEYATAGLVYVELDEEAMASLEGRNAKIFLYPFATADLVIAVESDTYTFDVEKAYAMVASNNLTSLLFVGFFVLLLVSLAILCFVKFRKTPKEVEKDIIEQLAGPQTFAATPIGKKLSFWVILTFSVLMLLAIVVIIFGSIDDTSGTFNVLLYSWSGLAAAFCVVWISLLPTIKKKHLAYWSKFYDFSDNIFKLEEKTATYFVDYASSLYFKFEKEALIFKEEFFEEAVVESIKIQHGKEAAKEARENFHHNNVSVLVEALEKDEFGDHFSKELRFDYEKLNFYVKFASAGARFIVVSDMNEEDAQGLKQNMVFVLDADLYYWIQKYKIYVDGLDYVMEHKDEILKKYWKGKQKIVAFKNEEEIILNEKK
ncbi:MAG: hypothetical protein J6K39_01315 [Clostridia bacterium]|nr:hypothetical protein [Clostridia bacterium]